MTVQAPADVVTTEIIRNFFQSCAEDMNAALIRSAYSPVIYESKDCSVALLDPNGDVLGQSSGLPIFLGALEVPVKHTMEQQGAEVFRPGDVYFVNDPYITGAHINDVTVFAPIFWRDELAGFTVSRAHWMDLGAKDPGVTMNSTDVYQEGLRAGPTKLFEDYEPRREWVDLLVRNSRFPDTLIGDLNAQVTACHTGEQRFRAALERFGRDTLWAARDLIFRQTEQLEREAIRAMPDGVFRAEGTLDNDGAGSPPVKVAVELTIEGDRMSVDLTGTAPMARGSVNCGEAETLCAARVAYKCLILPDRGMDGGSFATFDVHVPPKTILSAEDPAACQYYYTPLGLLIDLMITALAESLPERAAAAHFGDPMNVCFAGNDPRHDDSPYFYIDATPGGWGAFAGGDGEDALMSAVNGSIKLQPAEVFEAKYPIRVTEYALRPDSEGPGRFRGGFGVRRGFQVDADASLYLWLERSVTPAWGLFGGQSAEGPRIHIGGSQDRHDLKVNRLTLRAGDTVVMDTGGGGGWGDPFERDPQAVLQDVADGLVSRERAAERYGVVIDEDLGLDVEATANRRQLERTADRLTGGG
jgi:N-methylhydantoinase B